MPARLWAEPDAAGRTPHEALTKTRPTAGSSRIIPDPGLILLAAAVGCVCGIYGIGGGSILAPILVGTGRSPSEAAPAALASTFVTSVAGVVTFTILAASYNCRSGYSS